MSSIRPAFGERGVCGAMPPFEPKAASAARSPSRVTQTRTRGFLRTGDGILWSVSERTRVQLPRGVSGDFQVYLNGVPQRLGVDFRREGDELVFEKRLVREGKLGFWRWASLFLGVAGTYRQNDSGDVGYHPG